MFNCEDSTSFKIREKIQDHNFLSQQLLPFSWTRPVSIYTNIQKNKRERD